jgi:hypothetical protein
LIGVNLNVQIFDAMLLGSVTAHSVQRCSSDSRRWGRSTDSGCAKGVCRKIRYMLWHARSASVASLMC